MKNWFIGRMLAWLGGKFDGKKTYLAGAALVLLGVAGCVGKMYPDAGLPEQDLDTSLGYISAGLAAFGVGHKIEKNTQITLAATPASSPATGTATDSSSP